MGLPTPSANSTCIVTGASSGIGVEIARELARRGHGVTLVARREDRLKTLADELSSKQGVRVEVVPADLTDPAARAELVAAVAERGLTVDVLVNNAGFGTTGRTSEADVERELDMIRTNVEAVVDLTTRVLPGLVERGRGGILNVASTAAFQPLPGQAGYAATKAFVLSYSEAIAAEVKRSGVTVTALCPGPVRTEFGDAAGFSAAEMSVPEFIWVSAEEVAKAGVDALAAGRLYVVPGAANKFGAVTAAYLPRSVLLPILGRAHPALRRKD
jgi:short-subunit dehydrogenase